MDNSNLFKKVFQAINDFFDPKYIDTTPIPKQEKVPDELVQKVLTVFYYASLLNLITLLF